jgi:hypothetical protein
MFPELGYSLCNGSALIRKRAIGTYRVRKGIVALADQVRQFEQSSPPLDRRQSKQGLCDCRLASSEHVQAPAPPRRGSVSSRLEGDSGQGCLNGYVRFRPIADIGELYRLTSMRFIILGAALLGVAAPATAAKSLFFQLVDATANEDTLA